MRICSNKRQKCMIAKIENPCLYNTAEKCVIVIVRVASKEKVRAASAIKLKHVLLSNNAGICVYVQHIGHMRICPIGMKCAYLVFF